MNCQYKLCNKRLPAAKKMGKSGNSVGGQNMKYCTSVCRHKENSRKERSIKPKMADSAGDVLRMKWFPA